MSGGGTIQPHRLYPERCLAMNHRRYIAWYRSTAQVIFATWRAADCRPYGHTGWVVSFCPHGLYLLRPRNGTQAVPYGFAGRPAFSSGVFEKRLFFVTTLVTRTTVNPMHKAPGAGNRLPGAADQPPLLQNHVQSPKPLRRRPSQPPHPGDPGAGIRARKTTSAKILKRGGLTWFFAAPGERQ